MKLATPDDLRQARMTPPEMRGKQGAQKSAPPGIVDDAVVKEIRARREKCLTCENHTGKSCRGGCKLLAEGECWSKFVNTMSNACPAGKW